MDRQYNDHKKKNKGTNNDLQNITEKTKDRATRIPLNQYRYNVEKSNIKFICTRIETVVSKASYK